MKTILHYSATIAVGVLLCLSVFAQSQSTTGLIQGNVFDQTGAVIQGASVVVKNTETGFERTVTSNSDGFFSAPLLPLGKYLVTAEASGFARTNLENIILNIGQTLSLRVELKAGGAATTVVDVTSEGETVETNRTELNTLINSKAVENLPISRRDFSKFVQLTPGVSIVQGPDGDEITINGQKGIQNNFSIDGADANNPFFGEQRGGQRPAFTISLESIKEFQVVPVGASAEFGRSSGGFINAVTKSGTNEFTGSAFVFYRNQKLSSQNPDAVKANLPTEDFRNYQFGANVGGPIKKDRAFFFVAYERNDGLSNKPNSIDPRLVSIFRTRFNSEEQGTIERTNIADVLLGKVDVQVNKNNLLTVRHNYSRAEQINGTFDVPTWGISANGRETNNSNSFITQLVTNVSANLLNEFRFQYAKENRPRFYDGPDLPDTTIGTFDGSLSYRFGRPFFLPVPSNDVRFQFTDNFTVIAGNHTIKFGADFNRVKNSQTFIGFARGRYIFAGGTIDQAIQGFQNYIANVPAGSRNVSGLALYLQFAPIGNRTVEEAGTQEFVQFEPGVYVQDNWNVRQNLTLNLGLRWEGQYQPDPITSPQNTRYGQFLSDPRFPSDGTIPDFKNGFQPRAGLSYSPGKDGKTAIRLGAGIFYARIPGLVIAGPRNTDGAIAGNIFFGGFLALPPPVGINLPAAAFPVFPGIVPTAGFTPFNPGIAVFERDFKNPQTVQFSASVERELVRSLSLTVAFNYAKTVHLTRFINRGDGRLYGGASPFERANGSGVGEIRSTESSGRSEFKGLSFVVNKRFANRFQFQANYLLSYDKSDDDNERDPFSFRYADPRDLTSEYGFSDRDQRHRFNAFATFSAPYGINISPIFQARSAQPTSVANRGTFPNIIQRNTLRLKNKFYSFDIRATKVFKFTERISLEPIFEAFNIFNNRNQRSLPRPLTFNFDGTVSAGFGEPRQIQLGLRFRF
ncbi:MAG: TonB-dependent receptor [Pyrinomonadaceae bacterium]|nr:TonB-dependent receptor [Pyrinomonadaceae bacterium]